MVKIEVMDSSPVIRPTRHVKSFWHNKRIQRSALFGFAFLCLISTAFYSRESLPGITDGRFDSFDHATGKTTDTRPPVASPKYGKLDDNETLPDAGSPPASTVAIEKAAPATPASVPSIKNGPQKIEFDPTRVALIIETRPVVHLPTLIQTFIAVLPDAWTVKLVGALPAFELIRKSPSLRRHITSGKLLLVDLPDEYPTTNNNALTATLTNITFYRDFLAPAEWVLMFQTDSIICGNSPTTVDDWVERGYDWTGAPWNADVAGGNGGLSLRHIPPIVKVLETDTWTEESGLWEDRWLCDRLQNLAPAKEEMNFSVESVYTQTPFGYHLRGSGKSKDASIWADRVRRRQILEYCPEVKIVLGIMQPEDPEEDMLRAADLAGDQSGLEDVIKTRISAGGTGE